MADLDTHVQVPKTVYVRWYCESCKYHHEVKADKAQLDSVTAYMVLDLGTTDLRCKKIRYKEEKKLVVDKQAYKAGQRIRAEWRNGTGALEGVLESNSTYAGGLVLWLRPGYPSEHLCPQSITGLLEVATITVLSEPRPDEPTGLGAVVRASDPTSPRDLWIRVHEGQWRSSALYLNKWAALIDPEVLSEGWAPPKCTCRAIGKPRLHSEDCPQFKGEPQ